MASIIPALIPLVLATSTFAADPWLVFQGGAGAGRGKHIVLISGDEEYRSEESLPMLGQLLARKHGFKCTVLFPVDPKTGEINPNEQTNIPGIEAIDSADFVILCLRFRELPDEKMKHFVNYVESGKPLLGLRTSTHAFNYSRNRQSPYASWSFDSDTGGFGKQVLGETWINHHGDHGKESTRGMIEAANRKHPLLAGVTDVWGPTDVYGVTKLPDDATVLLRGQVLSGMSPDDKAIDGTKNDPMMPLAWVRKRDLGGGRTQKVICTTMGAATDFEKHGLRRLVVNAAYWACELPVRENLNVEPIGEYKPSAFGIDGFRKGTKPSDFR